MLIEIKIINLYELIDIAGRDRYGLKRISHYVDEHADPY